MDLKTAQAVIQRQVMKLANADLQSTIQDVELEQLRAELEQVKARNATLEAAVPKDETKTDSAKPKQEPSS